jgi:hypothetical protein
VTVSFAGQGSGSCSYPSALLAEVSGLSSPVVVDGSCGNNGSSSAAGRIVACTINTSAPDFLVSIFDEQGPAGDYSAVAPWALLQAPASNGASEFDEVTASSGAVSVSANLKSGTTWQALAAAFRVP